MNAGYITLCINTVYIYILQACTYKVPAHNSVPWYSGDLFQNALCSGTLYPFLVNISYHRKYACNSGQEKDV